MASGILPSVKFLFACDSGAIDLQDEKWILKNPWAVVQLPRDSHFPFRCSFVWIYAQFTDGVGESELLVEMRQILDNGNRRTIKHSNAARMDFPGGEQILVRDTLFRMTKVPFREAGLYELVVTSDGRMLEGARSEIRVLDRRSVL